MGGYLAVRIAILSEALYTGDAALLALGLWAHACLEAALADSAHLSGSHVLETELLADASTSTGQQGAQVDGYRAPAGLHGHPRPLNSAQERIHARDPAV